MRRLSKKTLRQKRSLPIASKETTVKKSIEIAKADLEQSNFLAQKFKAAAINLEAKVEAEELDDMAVNLDGMLDDETEAKEELKEAAQARVAAEKTLAEAKKTVVDGTKKLKDTTTSVLERALALIVKKPPRSLWNRKRHAKSPTEVAALDTTTNPTSGSASNPAGRSEEINAEIAAIEKRLKELSQSITQSYTEADKTKQTVVKASDVAAKTPPVIAQRTQVEKTKAEIAKSIEQQRKEQEATVEEQKKLISNLKKQYLEADNKKPAPKTWQEKAAARFKDNPTSDHKAQIESNLPTATAKPKKDRKILCFWRCEGFIHTSIPFCNHAVEKIAEATDAYQVDLADEYSVFTAENLKQYDAILFNNTTNLVPDEGQQKAILDWQRHHRFPRSSR
ncbi:hypothetical protein GQR58_030532 [Nymphon striatum]|nr:hypothetical protein GQR58_030532 [Nymphon striatum]